MPQINLLPWRESRRLRKNKEFAVLFALCVLVAMAVVLLVWRYLENELENQQLANDYVATETFELDKQLIEIDALEQRRRDMITRINVIESLQDTSSLPVRVWDDVAMAIPSAMYINAFTREADLLTFTGRSSNPNLVSNLVRNLDGSTWMGDSKVVYIKQNVDAYQTLSNQMLSNQPLSNFEQSRIVAASHYPENDYIDFVVTTQVSSHLNPATINHPSNRHSNSISKNSTDMGNETSGLETPL